jgi:hypothetical protein
MRMKGKGEPKPGSFLEPLHLWLAMARLICPHRPHDSTACSPFADSERNPGHEGFGQEHEKPSCWRG